jgi:hypothetical protein
MTAHSVSIFYYTKIFSNTLKIMYFFASYICFLLRFLGSLPTRTGILEISHSLIPMTDIST